MIYQALKNRATLDDALEVDAIFFIVGVRFYMTDPAAFFFESPSVDHGSATCDSWSSIHWFISRKSAAEIAFFKTR